MLQLVEVPKDKVHRELAQGAPITAIYITGRSTLGKCKFSAQGPNRYFLHNIMKREDVRFFKVVDYIPVEYHIGDTTLYASKPEEDNQFKEE